MKGQKMTKDHLDYIQEFGSQLTVEQLCQQLGFGRFAVEDKLRKYAIRPVRAGSAKVSPVLMTFEKFKSCGCPRKLSTVKKRWPAVYSNPNWEARIDELLAMDV